MRSSMAWLMNEGVWFSWYILRKLIHHGNLRTQLFFINLLNYNFFIFRLFILPLGSNFLFFLWLFWLASIRLRPFRWWFLFDRWSLIQVTHFVVMIYQILGIFVSCWFRSFLVRQLCSVKHLFFIIIFHVLVVVKYFTLSGTLVTASSLRWAHLIISAVSCSFSKIAAFALAKPRMVVPCHILMELIGVCLIWCLLISF